MKKLVISAAVVICACAFTSAQAQDSTRHSQNKSGTMKKGKMHKQMNNNRRSTTDSTNTYGINGTNGINNTNGTYGTKGTMNNRRRDSL